MRENARMGRTPQQVIDDAMWGVFQEGWLEGYGADADHLKTPEDIDRCVAAGYTFFTIDPGDHVDNAAHTAPLKELEALRVIARVNPSLFRKILALAITRYPTDRATYHVSARLENVPDPATVPDEFLDRYLGQFDARQVLHVTYGSALEAYGDAILRTLREHEEAYHHALESHFRKHLQTFATPGKTI